MGVELISETNEFIKNPNDGISTIVIGFIMYPCIQFVLSRKIKHIWFAIGMVYIVGLASSIKSFTSSHSDRSIFFRPQGAKGCDVMNRRGDSSFAPGFPSGHMATIAFFAVFALLAGYVARDSVRSYIIIMSIVCLCMANARLSKKCHNTSQVTCGIVIGSLMGYAWLIVGRNALGIH